MHSLLDYLVRVQGADLYITVDSPPVVRVENELIPCADQNLSDQDVQCIVEQVLAVEQQREFERTHELNLGISDQTLGRFRVNVYRQRNSPALVIRRISSTIPSLRELGLPPTLQEVSLSRRGLVLVVGATGSGKSTTLASMIDYRNANSAGHIVTIEDPIEFVYSHKRSLVSQREVGIDTLSFHSALKNALRQAPDVILLGEIRDAETMEAAVAFAETGHLCLATLHSNNASQAIERIMNFFPAERHQQIYLQLGLNLRAIVGQRLVPTVSGTRIAACELLLDSPRIKDLIMKGEIGGLREAMEKSGSLGMHTFDQRLFELYEKQIISLDQALAHADSPNNVRLRISLVEQGNNGVAADEEGELQIMR